VRAVYSTQPADRCKGSPPVCRPVPPSPAERARRVAEIRQVLAGSAPTFQARLDAVERREQP
jgi:hypothetical protein